MSASPGCNNKKIFVCGKDSIPFQSELMNLNKEAKLLLICANKSPLPVYAPQACFFALWQYLSELIKDFEIIPLFKIY